MAMVLVRTTRFVEPEQTLFGMDQRPARCAERGIHGDRIDDRRDAARLITQLEAVRRVLAAAMTRGEWLTVEDIEREVRRRFGIRCPQASASAQVRNLRKPGGGGHRIDSRYREGIRVMEYRMAVV